MNLNNKIVVITGGSKGIGKALAISFIKEGSIVVISSHNEEELKKTSQELNITAIMADVTKEEQVNNLAEKVIEDFGKIDIWVNNAGILYRFSNDESVDMEKVHNMFDVNLMGTVFGCQVALKYMKNNNDSMILNIISKAAIDATRAIEHKLYAASKWATRGFMEAFKFENINSGIKIISVYPGGVQTDLWKGLSIKDIDKYLKPEEVAIKIIENIKKDNPEEELVIKRSVN